MSQITVEHLSFSYAGSYDVIFEDVNFQLDTDWKLGFIGRNGRGKTTFLHLLLGKYDYKGKITAQVKFDYFPYPVEVEGKETHRVLQEVCPEAEEWEFLKEFAKLGMGAEVWDRPFATLSQGEQTKALLAGLFLRTGCFFLLDEPTNHLDREGRRVVSAYLKGKKGFILVSHDKDFLDGCVDHILSINRSNIEIQKGTFSTWMENFKRQQSFEEATYDRLKKEASRLEEGTKRSSAWSHAVEGSKNGVQKSGLKADKGYVGHKAAKMMKRAKSMEQRQEKALEDTKGLLKNVEKQEVLTMTPLPFPKERLVSFSGVSVSYDGVHQVIKDVSFEILAGERVALSGKNGSGKSSLLQLLMGADIPHTGIVQRASGLVISYVSQNTDHLQGSLKDYAKANAIDLSLFQTILRKMNFERLQFQKNMEDFSSGQKKKVLLARSLCEKAHLYLWDEPLNFIDVYTWMQLEQLLLEVKPTMVFVEHDRSFEEAIATKIIDV